MKISYTSKVNFAPLHALKAQLKELDKTTVDVGVLEDKNTRTKERNNTGKIKSGSTTNNATVGHNLEHGEFSNGNLGGRKRSFIRMPLEQYMDDAIKTSKVVTSSGGDIELTSHDVGKVSKGLDNVPDSIGKTAVKVIKTAFDTAGYGNWPDEAPSTIDRKGFSQPGVDTEQLKKSISYRVNK